MPKTLDDFFYEKNEMYKERLEEKKNEKKQNKVNNFINNFIIIIIFFIIYQSGIAVIAWNKVSNFLDDLDQGFNKLTGGMKVIKNVQQKVNTEDPSSNKNQSGNISDLSEIKNIKDPEEVKKIMNNSVNKLNEFNNIKIEE